MQNAAIQSALEMMQAAPETPAKKEQVDSPSSAVSETLTPKSTPSLSETSIDGDMSVPEWKKYENPLA